MITLRANISGFLKDWDRVSSALPTAIVTGVGKTAIQGRDAVRRQTRKVFNLHSDYITNAISATPDPNRARAIVAATKALMGKYRDFMGYVYIKGATNPKKSFNFMVIHETGGIRRPIKGSSLAVPAKDIMRYSFKNKSGAIQKRWKPASLLKYYNRVGAAKKGHKRHKSNTRSKPKAFLLPSAKKNSLMIVRTKSRKSRSLEFLYSLKPDTKIRKRWNFVRTAHSIIFRYLSMNIAKQINKVR